MQKTVKRKEDLVWLVSDFIYNARWFYISKMIYGNSFEDEIFYETYEKTKDSKEPQLNFPISILVLDDDKNEYKELVDHKELKEAMSYCSRGKGKGGDGDNDGDGDGKGKRG